MTTMSVGQEVMLNVPMTAYDVRRSLAKYWPPEKYVTIEEAPDSADRNGRKLDALVCSVWSSRGYEIEGVEIKVSMSDWQRELKDCAKADWWYRHVHRFWVAVPVPLALRIAADVPNGWGLLACSESGCKVVTKASRHDAEPLPWSSVLGLLRSATGCGLNALARARQEGIALGEQRAREQQERLTGDYKIREELEKLRASVAAFEKISGVNLNHHWGIEDSAKAVAVVKCVLDGKYDVGRMDRVVEQIEQAAKKTRELATAVKALTEERR